MTLFLAAHCFWDASKPGVFDAAFYVVGAGKYFREYSAAEYFNPQGLNVTEIVVHDK